MSTHESIYQLTISLEGSRPLIWRKLQVDGDSSLAHLHQIFQAAMGWFDCHLHEFSIGGTRYSLPDPGDDSIHEDERRFTLAQVVPTVPARFSYLYDFGDGWEHRIQVEKIIAPDTRGHYPCCLAGDNACPPEDCGGLPGYIELLNAVSDPVHPEHETMLDWLGGVFDPTAFDLALVNERLRDL